MTDDSGPPSANGFDRRPGAPTGTEGAGARIGCCLRPGRDRELLVEWLAENGYRPTVVTPGTLDDEPFDCCIVDVATLRDAEAALRRRRQEEPGLVPCLLLTPEDASETLGGLPRSVASIVTDVLSTPLRTVVLRRRLENALSARRLSTALAGSRERYRRVVEQAPAAVFLLDDGAVTYLNEAAEQLLGRPDTAIVGRSLVEFLTEPDRDRIASLFDELGVGESTEFVEAVFAGAARSVPVELAATQIATEVDAELASSSWFEEHNDELDGNLQVVAHDVSRRKAREDQLRLYRRAMDAATVGISITNPSLPDNPLVYVNEEFERLAGRSREELIGRNARILQSPNTDPDAVAELRRAIDAGESASVELLNRRPDGTEWYNALDVTPIHGPDGEVEYFLGFQRDVTERRERELRMVVLDRVLRHNIRNRLNVVLGHVAELEAGSEDVDAHAARIRSASEDLLSLSNAARRFRSVLRTETGGEPARLDHVIARVLSSLREEFPDVELETSLTPVRVPSAVGVDLAVAELVANAARYAGDRPTVRVTLRREGTEAVVTVTDDGPGLPADERMALLGRAESPVEHASGLGLWLVRWVVDDLGGDAVYEEDDSAGAVVTLRIPASDEDGQAADG
ncbi:hypothetical protein JCM17823_16120 [Halorubrum gandharaense]